MSGPRSAASRTAERAAVGSAPVERRRARRGGRLLAAAAVVSALAAPAAARELHWRALEVEARLEADGFLHVRESQTMVFTGDWNGGERVFRLAVGQPFELLGVWRLDEASGELLELAGGSLAQVDRYDFVDRTTLRWRSRMPGDPPFDDTAITYVLEYRMGEVLRPLGEGYRLDHDFAFTDRVGVIERFRLELELDPVWRPLGSFTGRFEAAGLPPGAGHVVTVDLAFAGEGRPAGVRHPPPLEPRLAAFALAALAMVALYLDFRRGERATGRYDRPSVPPGIDRPWLEQSLFDLLPEEVGGLWERRVGAPEVAALLASWESEGKIASEVEPARGFFQRDKLTLRLVADRDEFTGYEAALVKKLFFGGRTETDTEAIRERYRKTGFDPAGTIRSGINRRLKKLYPTRRRPEGDRRAVTAGLWLAFLALMAVAAVLRPLPTLHLAGLLIPPLVVLYLLFGLIPATAARLRVLDFFPFALLFLVPGLLFLAVMAALVFFDRWLPGVAFEPQPGVWASAALAALAVGVWSSLLNNARTRETPEGVRKRQLLTAARRLLAAELRRERPALEDAWMPYLLALGLGPRVDGWWRRFGAATGVGTEAVPTGGFSGRSSGGGWTGGGGAFGGGGASASWAAAATGLAAGVARPSSGGGGGSSGGGGGSSGGGGGGGW